MTPELSSDLNPVNQSETEILSLEKELLKAVYAADKEAMTRMMVPDGAGIGASFSHAARAAGWDMTETKVLLVSRVTGIVTYTLLQQELAKGTSKPGTVYATTVWVCRSGQWQALFHQETPAA